MKYLESIVAMLNRAGLVRSLRGKGGGYRLTRPPESCSVGEILQLTEGSMAPVYCLEPGGACEKSERCITYPMWRQLDQLIDSYLRRVSLADLLQGRLPQDLPLPPAKDRSSGNNGLQVRRIEAWQNQVTPLRHISRELSQGLLHREVL